MFLDAYGTPKDVTEENLHEYPYNLHGVMLLTSADQEVYIPPRWHGTIYSTDSLLDSYRARFNPDSTMLTFHAMEVYEPELICCERCVIEMTVMPAGISLKTGNEIVVFLVKICEGNTVVTKELGNELNIFPNNHHYHVRIMDEGIDILYVDDKVSGSDAASAASGYHNLCVQNLVKKLQPLSVKSLSGNPLPEQLCNMCRKVEPNAEQK